MAIRQAASFAAAFVPLAYLAPATARVRHAALDVLAAIDVNFGAIHV
jgi:hypothetical protein